MAAKVIDRLPMRELVAHASGGGWGAEAATDGTSPVAIIRGADFPQVESGDARTLPVRWETDRKIPQRTLEAGDIVLEISGGTDDRPTGRTVFVTDRLLAQHSIPVIPASFCRLIRVDRKKVDPRYAYYWLQSMYSAGRTWEYQNRSTGLSNFQFNYFLDAETVDLPPLDEQRRIAHILGTLDDKIELNRRMNETLEEMARALFKSWFVDFDPVRAKAGGRDPGLPKHLADLFPDRLVDSELGEIPEGWQVLPVDDEFRVTIGRTPPRKEAHWFSKEPTDVPWVSIRDMGQAGAHLHEAAEYLTHDAVSTHRVEVIPAGTVLLSFKLTVGRVSIASRPLVTNEAIAHFHPRSANSVGAVYLYSYLKQFDYGALGNTSSIANAVNLKSVRALRLLRPTPQAEGVFANVTEPVFAKMQALDVEARTLAALRDVLLANVLQAARMAR